MQQQFRYMQQRPSTQFGRVTTVTLNQMRFFSFGLRGTF
jgi:hypothetical protein